MEQLRRDFVIDLEHTGVDDAQLQTSADGVVQKRRMHRLANPVVAAEGEGDVAYAATHAGIWQMLFDPARSTKKIDRIVVVLFDAGSDRKNVGVEDDVFGRKVELLCENGVGAPADLYAALEGVRLPLFVERHNHNGGAIFSQLPGKTSKLILPLFQTNRVYNTLALDVLEAGFDHTPLRGVDHDRDPCNVRLYHRQAKKALHRLLRIEHPFVHVDVDHLSPVFHLLAGYTQRFVKVAGFDELGELGGSGNIGPLADIHKVGFPGENKWFQPAGRKGFPFFWEDARGIVCRDRRQGLNVLWGGSATSAHQVQPALFHIVPHLRGEIVRRLIVLPKFIGQTRIGVQTGVYVGDVRQLLDVGAHLARPQRTIEPDA